MFAEWSGQAARALFKRMTEGEHTQHGHSGAARAAPCAPAQTQRTSAHASQALHMVVSLWYGAHSVKQHTDCPETGRPRPNQPLDDEVASLLKRSKLASCEGVKRLLEMRTEYEETLHTVTSEEHRARAQYAENIGTLCDALEELIDPAVQPEAAQSFWISIIGLVDKLERFRAERALRWDADGGRICATRFTVLTARASALALRVAEPATHGGAKDGKAQDNNSVAPAGEADDGNAVAAVRQSPCAAGPPDSAPTLGAGKRKRVVDEAKGFACKSPKVQHGGSVGGVQTPASELSLHLNIREQNGEVIAFKVLPTTKMVQVRTLHGAGVDMCARARWQCQQHTLSTCTPRD